ncbi:MAG: hypothetical protein LBR26_14175 [Prevotella sp.]|jgi:hypothetical protein|nr:hypothetical protein [Prevotella sp.]
MKKLSKPQTYIVFIACSIGGVAASLLTNFGIRPHDHASKFVATVLLTAAIGGFLGLVFTALYKLFSRRKEGE